MGETPCFACGGLFPPTDGPTHKYMLSSPGCWAAYGAVLAREYENAVLFGAVHLLTVGAYALQHPADAKERRAVQSVWVHYASLYLVFEEKRSLAEAQAGMQTLVGRNLALPGPVPDAFPVTVRDVVDAGVEGHVEAVRRWALCAYQAWPQLKEPTRRVLAGLPAGLKD